MIFITVLLLSSCMTLTHTVGNGGTGQYKVQKRAVYAAFGLVPLKKVDSRQMANGAVNYTIQSKFTLMDFLIAIPALPFTVHTQTVIVSE